MPKYKTASQTPIPNSLLLSAIKKIYDSSELRRANTLLSRTLHKLKANKFLTSVQIIGHDAQPISNLNSQQIQELILALKCLPELTSLNLQNLNFTTNNQFIYVLYNLCHLNNHKLQHVNIKLARKQLLQPNLIRVNQDKKNSIPESLVVRCYTQLNRLDLTSLTLNITTSYYHDSHRTFLFRHDLNPKTKLFNINIYYPANPKDSLEVIQPILLSLTQFGHKIAKISLSRVNSSILPLHDSGIKIYDINFPFDKFPNLKLLNLRGLDFKDLIASEHSQCDIIKH